MTVYFVHAIMVMKIRHLWESEASDENEKEG